MYRTKLLKDYQKFSPAEKRNLIKYCEENTSHCDYRKLEMTKLAEFLIAQNTFTPKNVDRKRVFKYIYGKEDFDAGKFEDLMSCFHSFLDVARILNKINK